MDTDENDILYSNTFIPTPELSNEVSNDTNSEFRKFYEKEKSINEEKKLKDNMSIRSIRSIRLAEDSDETSLLNTNKFSIDKKTTNATDLSTRKKKEIITYISVDSRDRDKLLYEKPSYFKIFLGKSFYNVKEIKLASIEFPNTNAVINSSNNKIYWRNKEDIDRDIINAITNTYPVYNVTLRIGSYISTSLQNELTNKMAIIKRRDNIGDYHYFLVSLDIDTDIVTFTSLILTQLSNDTLQTSVNTGIIQVTAPNHGYSNGENIYLIGAKTIAGISSNTLNTMHEITVVNSNLFQFEINTKAAETLTGGGNTLKTGKIAPFQFLFGDNSNTVAQNIGYPLENSSELINTYISSFSNLYQATIVLTEPHYFTETYDYLGQTCNILSSNTSPSINGNRRITQIISSTSFNIKIDSKLLLESYNSGQITINSKTYSIQSISNYNVNTILVSTFTDHNYTFDNIGTSINFYNTTTTPNLDGTNSIFSLYETNSFVILGSLPSGGEISTTIIGDAGSIPRNTPLLTHTVKVTNIVIGSSTITLTCPNHNLEIGDNIVIYNLISNPSLLKLPLTIFSIPNSNTIILNTTLTSFDNTNLLNESIYIGTGLTTMSFPNHGFNKIISIQNTSGFPSGQTYGNLIKVQTQLSHNFTNNQLVRFEQTNCLPLLNTSFNITVLDSDEFLIPSSYPLVSPGSSGIIGFNQDFNLYGAHDIGGIISSNINNSKFTVRDIIDENTFTFYNSNAYASSIEIGGGDSLYISSLSHGFSGQQTNTKNNLLNRSINLQGENYAFLSCPQLSTMMNTGNIKDVFARISLDQSPGTMVFSYLSNPKTFDTTPLSQLNEVEFSILNHDGSLYEFNDLDYSFTLQITEVIDITDNFNLSSKRGI